MFGHPGKKLMFMGSEFGQWREWSHDESLDWHLLDHEDHRGLQRWVRDLNRALLEQPALHQVDFDHTGFEWIDCSDIEGSIVSFRPSCARSIGLRRRGGQLHAGAAAGLS